MEIVFSRGGDLINIEIVDSRNRQKALYSINRSEFIEAMAVLGCLKVVEVVEVVESEQRISIKDF